MRLWGRSGGDINKVIHREYELLPNPSQIKHLARFSPDHFTKTPQTAVLPFFLPRAMPHPTPVLVQTPAHSQVAGALTYTSTRPLPPGTLVRVPLGRRDVLGVVWDGAPAPAPGTALRPITAVLDALPPLPADWRTLVAFAARYYQRAAGEVALAALPPALRDLDAVQLARRLQRKAPAGTASPPEPPPRRPPDKAPRQAPPDPSRRQRSWRRRTAC